MSQKTITYLAGIGATFIIVCVAIIRFTEALKEHPAPAWFILGFGSCMVVEAIAWWIVGFINKRFS
jgi:hypothetical protein